MLIQEALKETGKAKRDRWEEKEYIYKQGMYFIDNEGKPFNREDIVQDVWQPYHEVKEIRPEKAGELWQRTDGEYFHTNRVNGNIRFCGDAGREDSSLIKYVIHNKNGWERLFPKVEDDSVEGLEIECPNCELKATLHGIDHISQILKLTCSCCGNEIPKEKPC